MNRTWPALPTGVEWDENGSRTITRDGIANLVYAIALSAFDQMDGESYREFLAKTYADPNAPRWIRP